MGGRLRGRRPLAGGFLAGKYERAGQGTQPVGGAGRLSGANPFSGPFTKFTERNWGILDALRSVAAQLDRPLAQVALAWVARQPSVTAPIVGASRPEQLQDHLAALNIRFSAEQAKLLDEAIAPGLEFFSAGLRRMVFGGADVKGWL